MYFRQLISFLLAILLGLSSAGAYIPEHLREQGTQAQKSVLQVESAILLREDGTPRCRIGVNPSEYLTAEKLDEFYRQGLDIGTLRECDQSDELYAISVLGNEEISMGMVAPPGGKGASAIWKVGKAIVLAFSLGGLIGCSLLLAEGHGKETFFLGLVTVVGLSAVGPASLLYFLGYRGGPILISSSVISMFGAGYGRTGLCHKLAEKKAEKRLRKGGFRRIYPPEAF